MLKTIFSNFAKTMFCLFIPMTGMLHAADTVKIGFLHSLSGTMAISETTLKDTMEMLIEDQNKEGGLLGMELEAVVVDPASNWPLFAEKARELIEKEKVVVQELRLEDSFLLDSLYLQIKQQKTLEKQERQIRQNLF